MRAAWCEPCAKDREVEVHLLEFATESAFERFRADPKRQALSGQLVQSAVAAEVHEVRDVDAYGLGAV